MDFGGGGGRGRGVRLGYGALGLGARGWGGLMLEGGDVLVVA